MAASIAVPTLVMALVAGVGTALAGHPERPVSRTSTRDTVAVVATTSLPTALPLSRSARPLDPRFETCRAANARAYGPYVRGVDPEYDWYRDGNGDGVVCD